MSIQVIEKADQLTEYEEAFKKLFEGNSMDPIIEYVRKFLNEGDETLFKAYFFSALTTNYISLDIKRDNDDYLRLQDSSPYHIISHIFGNIDSALFFYTQNSGVILDYDTYKSLLDSFLNNLYSIYKYRIFEFEPALKQYFINKKYRDFRDLVRKNHKYYAKNFEIKEL